MSEPAPPPGRLNGSTADPAATWSSATAGTTTLPRCCAHPHLAHMPVAQAGQVFRVDPQGERRVQAGQGGRALNEHPAVPHRPARHQAQPPPVPAVVVARGLRRGRGRGWRRRRQPQQVPGRQRSGLPGRRWPARPGCAEAGRASPALGLELLGPGAGSVGASRSRADDRKRHGRSRVQFGRDNARVGHGVERRRHVGQLRRRGLEAERGRPRRCAPGGRPGVPRGHLGAAATPSRSRPTGLRARRRRGWSRDGRPAVRRSSSPAWPTPGLSPFGRAR